MKCILILFIKLLLLLLLFGSSASHSSLKVSQVNHAPAKRSLMSFSDDRDTALVATVDGTINLVYRDSGRIIWSFASGSPIYSSYQAPISRVDDDKENAFGPGSSYFVDCGDDWKLYVHTDLGKANLDMSIEDFLRLMPHVAEDGGVIVGSEKTTAFQVDAKTGRLIRGYNGSPDPRNQETRIQKDIPKPGEQLIFTRKDYLLTSYAANSDKVLWNVTVADIGVSFLCQENPNTISPHRDNDNDLPSIPEVSFNMPVSCQSKAVVHRLRSSHILDSFNMLGRQTQGKHRVLMLQLPPNDPLQPNPDTSRKSYHEHDFETRTPFSLPSEARDSQISHMQEVKKANYKVVVVLAKGHIMLPIISVFIVIAFLMYRHHVVMVGKWKKQPDALNAKSASSKRKKLRKSGKNNGHDDGNSQIDCERNSLNFNHLIECDIEGRSIGKLFVTSKELAKGSNGTIVLEGIYEGRKVAVKRLVKAHHDVAFKEIQNLIASDQHPNIVRWYGVEYDQDFVYLSLELCNCSLYDLIQMYSESFQKLGCIDGQVVKAMTDYKGHSTSMKGVMQDFSLWRANGYPSPTLLKLMRDIVSGLVHLHQLGIIHRDLKPHNVLIVKERSLCGKLSDMGISRRLVGDMSSLGHHATGSGSSGWQAPEQLLLGRQTRAVDLFSLGCVLFFCITCGRHPFGDHIERDVNVAKNHVNLFLVQHIPEALDLFSRLLNPNAALRPKASEVLHHPLLWDSETRLSFLRDTSDRVELEDREADSNILKSLESKAPVALGGKWDEKMEPAFITNIGRYRRYKYNGVRDLLRVIRNKLNHYRELPKEIQELLGSVPEGFDEYFGSRFPKLLMEVYKVMYSYCNEEEWFSKYLNIAVL